MSEDEALSEPFRLADAAFREFAEMTAANEGGTFEQAHKATWRLFELWISEAGGRGRSPPRPGVHNPGGAACRRQAEPAIGRLLAADVSAARGRTEREQGSQLEPNNPSNLIEVGPVGSSNDPRIAVGDMA